ncbi:MAG: GNAT family N-acetyltransferase [Pseudomonadota bacterium]
MPHSSAPTTGAAPADPALVHAIEQRCFNAWPARQAIAHGGWLFRLSGGFTKRANSINAAVPGAAFEGVREAAEAVYAQHGLPAIFRMSPLAPAAADTELTAAGYTVFDPSLVLWKPELPAEEVAAQVPAQGITVDIAAAPTDAWLEGFATANGVAARHHALHHAMVAAIAPPAAFATVREWGLAIGFGLAVAEGGAVGFYDIVIAPDQRGRGHGRTLMEALLRWGRSVGAHQAYLQVRAENPAALRLYGALGFGELYRYHYRVPPAHG